MKMWNKIQAEACKRVLKQVIKLLCPPPALSVWGWGELRRRMGRNVTAKPGRYQVETCPFQREPQESFTHPDVQTTVLYWAKRLGKTEMINNLHGSTIEQTPRNILVVYPTLDGAKRWSKQFFEPMRKATPAIKKLIKDMSGKGSNNTILSKEYPGGTISAIGSNSPSGFRQVQAPVVTCDEIDAMKPGEEGDPITLAFGRAENYSDSVQVVASTATRLVRKVEEGEDVSKNSTGSRIHDWWLRSDQRKWFAKSPCCGNSHVLAWANVKWPEGHKHDQAWYECPDCHAKWDDAMRLQAICAGEWRATAPFKGIRGYWLNGLNTTFSAKKGYKSKLHQMAAEFYDAYVGGEASRISWKNTFLCEPHIEESEKVDVNPLYERLEAYTPDSLPEGIVCIFLLMDVQADRLEYEFIGLGEKEETWGIEYGKIQGDPEKDDVWETATQYCQRTFMRVDGAELKVDCVGCDHRHKGHMVRKFLRKCGVPKAYAIQGANTKQSLLVIPRKNRLYKMTLHSVSTDVAKDTLFARMRLKEPGARYMHYPEGNGYEKKTDGYFDQLTAEESRITYSHGYPEKHYEKVRERNEALDIRVYFLAAVDILRPAVSVIRQEIKRKLQAGKTEPRQIIKPASRPADPAPVEAKKTEAIPPKKKRFSFRARGF